MKTREEVARFIEQQLHWSYDCPLPKPSTHHYGKQELRVLLDFIYDGPPQTKEQEIST